VRHAAHDEFGCRSAEAVEILQDQPERPHQLRTFQLRQRRIELGDEQRIVVRQRGDEVRVNHEVVARGMTCSAGAAVPVERLLEEELRSLRDELVQFHPSRRAAG
jgi:hypothetical protein